MRVGLRFSFIKTQGCYFCTNNGLAAYALAMHINKFLSSRSTRQISRAIIITNATMQFTTNESIARASRALRNYSL